MSFIEKVKINRRNFLKTGTAATILAALGCGNKLKAVEVVAVNKEEGEWVNAACWHDCGGRCLNKVQVVDGIVVRQKTDDNYLDSFEYPQQRSCVRGRSQRKQVFAADRLKYPMVRKNWKPGGGNKSLRGRDEWVRVSWDEALNLIAAEIKRVYKDYGPRSVLVDCLYNNDYRPVFASMGGYVDTWSTSSVGNWEFTPAACGYEARGGRSAINDRMDLLNSEIIILHGSNPAWTSPGTPSYFFNQAKEAGAKFIGIDPVFNESHAMLDAEWVPVRPVTDIALLLAVAHTLLIEDDPINNPLIDWDFLKRCTIGFDENSMPAGVDKKKNFKDYVLGTHDKQPKNAKWASEICGTPEEQIKSLARKMGMKNKVAFLTSWAPARTTSTDNLPQLIMTIGAMTGHMGKPGHMTGVSTHRLAANGGPALVSSGGTGRPSPKNPVDDVINEPDYWNALMGKPYPLTGTPSNSSWRPREMRTVDIRILMLGLCASMQTRLGFNNGVEAIRKKIDCIIAPTPFYSSNAQYADIVLPVNSHWERPGELVNGNRELLLISSQVLEPMYESKSDYWIACEIAKKLGLKDLYTISEKQMFFNSLAGSTVINVSGTGYEPLCAITDEDIKRWGVDGKAQQGRVPIDELVRQGKYQVARKPGDPYGYIALENFCKDPEKYPTKFSESGKMEIYCANLQNKINAMGYSEIDAIPSYIEPIMGYEKTFSDWKKKIKGKYPYQMVTMHYMKRAHTVFDNIGQLSEAFKNPVYISAADAKTEGIVTGNTVLIESNAGKTLRTALVSQRVMPGCVVMLHGKWAEVNEKTGIDINGSDSAMCPDAISAGQGTSGYNSQIINISKYSDEPLTPDVEKPLKMVNL